MSLTPIEAFKFIYSAASILPRNLSDAIQSFNLVGEIEIVRLTLYVAQDIHYFRLQDVLPGGLEPLDTSLLTTMQQAKEP